MEKETKIIAVGYRLGYITMRIPQELLCGVFGLEGFLKWYGHNTISFLI